MQHVCRRPVQKGIKEDAHTHTHTQTCAPIETHANESVNDRNPEKPNKIGRLCVGM